MILVLAQLFCFYKRYRYGTSAGAPVCTENLNPDVMVMKSAQDGT